jgi:membrane fusion protein, copper/silver efflux system
MNLQEPEKTGEPDLTGAESPPPPGSRKIAGRRNGIVILLLLVAAGEAAYILSGRLTTLPNPAPASMGASERKVLYWYDPMHPQYKSDKPGKAPDCGMDLVPAYAEEPKIGPQSGGERKVLYWQDSMNPEYRSDKPGKAPDGMDLVPVYADSQSFAGESPPGAFRISPEKQQLIGVQYGRVELEPLNKSIRAVARLAYDETRVVRIHSKISGWIDRAFVDFTGQLVAKNQPLLSIYSPDIVATQEEYLLALRAREKLGNNSFPEVASGANSLLQAARDRLELWDVSGAQIRQLEETRKTIRNITLYSEAKGFVVARNAYDKQRITPETELYQIADLSNIWALVDLYEYEMADIRLGQKVLFALPAFPGRRSLGKVTYIYPQVENTTRTLRVRAELPNPDYLLKPDMYADAEINVGFGRQMSIPQDAVLDSGSDQTVFVALNDGYFEPRKVKVGQRVGDRVIVLSGLHAGEKIVTSGNFLIDSESRLKTATGDMSMPMPPDLGDRHTPEQKR